MRDEELGAIEIRRLMEENARLREIEEAARAFVEACYAGQGFATTLVLLVVLGNVLEDQREADAGGAVERDAA